jgi:hypothetical protein
MKPVLQSILVRFEREGMELSVSYEHASTEQPSPGTKKRTTRAARMARVGLQSALEGLVKGACSGAVTARILASLRIRSWSARMKACKRKELHRVDAPMAKIDSVSSSLGGLRAGARGSLSEVEEHAGCRAASDPHICHEAAHGQPRQPRTYPRGV